MLWCGCVLRQHEHEPRCVRKRSIMAKTKAWQCFEMLLYTVWISTATLSRDKSTLVTSDICTDTWILAQYIKGLYVTVLNNTAYVVENRGLGKENKHANLDPNVMWSERGLWEHVRVFFSHFLKGLWFCWRNKGNEILRRIRRNTTSIHLLFRGIVRRNQ